MATLIDQLRALLEPVLNARGFQLYDLTMAKEGSDTYLHVYVDRGREPIDLEQIVALSEELAPKLDEANLIPYAYVLDVASAGAEKRLKLAELGEYIDMDIKFHLTNPYQGENYIAGRLLSVTETEIELATTIKARQRVIELPRVDIDRANLTIIF